MNELIVVMKIVVAATAWQASPVFLLPGFSSQESCENQIVKASNDFAVRESGRNSKLVPANVTCLVYRKD